jgi:hypothetical protein
MLYADYTDSLSAVGVILADVWNNHRIIAIDQLGWNFLSFVRDGQTIDIKEDGTLTVQ